MTIAVRHLLRTFQFQKCTPVLLAGRKFTTTLNEEQLSIRKKVKDFSKEHLAPIAKKVDKEGRFPFKQISKLVELGFMGACVDDTYGGLGLDFVSLAIIIEELSRGSASVGMVASIHNFLYANLLNARGTPEQKEKFLTKFTDGSIGCFALSEPGAGTDVAGITVACRKDGDHWIINGRKSWVTSAIEGSAAIVFATFDPKLRHKGLNCFVVPLDAEGVFRGRKEHIMGVRAASASDVTFEDVRVPSSCLIGKPGEGFSIAMNQLDQGRIGIAAHAVGIAQSAVDTAINYGRNRKAFGKPLTHLPSVKPGDSHDSEPSYSGVDSESRIIGSLAAINKNRLSEMAILTDTARLLTYRAASQPSTKHSAMAKYTAGVNAVAVANHCVQIMGGRGLHTEYAAERHYRDARGTQIYGGVTDIQKILVGHYLLKEAGMPTATHRNE